MAVMSYLTDTDMPPKANAVKLVLMDPTPLPKPCVRSRFARRAQGFQGLVTSTCQRDCFAEDIDKRNRFSITKSADKKQMKIYDVPINQETVN